MKEVVEPAADELADRGLLRRVDASTLEVEAPTMAAEQQRRGLSPKEHRALQQQLASGRSAVCMLELPVTQVEDFALCPRRFRARHILRLPERPQPRTPQGPEVDPQLRPDPRRRGTIAHAALEVLDLERAGEDPDGALADALERVGASGETDLRDRLGPFIRGAYVKRLASLPGEQVLRELPFALAIENDKAVLLLRGQIDLVVDEGESVEIIDYKVSAPKGEWPTAPYAFQLSTYAAAVRRRSGDRVRIRTAIQFLDGRFRLPLYTSDTEPDVTDMEHRLASLLDALLDARRTGDFPGKDLDYCNRIRCGYVWLCHKGCMGRGGAVG
jgi:ATP-dependent exoDNAse (exonuclease V) beta subunit